MSKHRNRHLKESTGLLDANDEDGFMARSQLYFLARDAIKLHGMIGDRDELEPWVSASITKAAEALESIREYVEYNQMAPAVEPEQAPIEMPVEGMLDEAPRGPRGEADADMADELKMYGENDGQLYQQRTVPIQKNLSKKWSKGVYDNALAVKLWKYWADDVAKRYAQEFRMPVANVPTRMMVAQMMADEWQSEMEAGNLHEAVGEFADKFWNLVDELGEETVLNEVWVKWSSDEKEDFVYNINRNYDIDGDIEDLIEMLGTSKVLEEMARYMSGDDIDRFYDAIVREYSLVESKAAAKYRVVGTTTSGEKFKSGVMDKKAADDRHYKMTKQTDKRGKKIYKKIEVVKEEQVTEQSEFNDGSKALNPQTIATNMMKAAKAQAMKKVKK